MFHDVYETNDTLPYAMARYENNPDYDSKEKFKHKLEWIRKDGEFSDILLFDDIKDSSNNILTFDDGLLSDVKIVLPILLEYNIQAIFFVSGFPLIEKKVTNCHKIQFILAKYKNNLSELTRIILGKIDNSRMTELWDKYSVSTYKKNSWSSQNIFIVNLFRKESEYFHMIDELFDIILQENHLSEEEFVNKFYMSLEHLKVLKKNGMLIGVHGYYHSYEDNYDSISKTISYLKNHNLVDDIYYSYPNGNIQQYDILKRLNVKYAFTTESREVICFKNEDKLMLPRIHSKHIRYKSVKIVLLGVQQQGLDIAKQLIDNEYTIDAIVTISQEKTKKVSISGWVDYTDFCKENNIELYFCDKYTLNSHKDESFFKTKRFDLLLLGGWQRLIPESILHMLTFGGIGQHGSSELLPRGRGRSPLNWSIIQGRQRLVWNLFKIEPGIDDGDILDSYNINITPHDTCKTLYYKISICVTQMYLRTIPKIMNNTIVHTRQIGNPTFYEKRTPDDGIINWEKMSVSEIYNLIRAVTRPYPGAYTMIGPQKVTIWDAIPFDYNISWSDKACGEITHIFANELVVNCCDGLLLVKEHDYETPYIGDIFHL